MEFARARTLDVSMVDVKRHLLAISWAMPPLVYPRAIQVSRSLKELSRRGWAIDVIALDAGSNPGGTRDALFADCYSKFYQLNSIDIQDIHRMAARHWKIRGFLERRFAQFNPSDWAWKRRARSKAVDLIKLKHPQALITFAQPWVDHLIGLSIKHRFPSLPWVAHFSDPWTDGPYAKSGNPELLGEWRLQERKVIEAADEVVFVNDRTAHLVMSKYPAAWRRKVCSVPHGLDPELLEFISPRARQSERPRLVYTGSMFEGLRDPTQVLKAISCLKSMIPWERMPIIEFVGSGGAQYGKCSKELGIEELVRFSERTTYLEALQIASESDVLLLIDTNMENSVFLPSKVADYLMLGKPIFALAPRNGATTDILRPLGHTCIDSNDPSVIARALADILSMQVPSSVGVRQPRIAPAHDYHISNTTDRLEAAINAAICREALH